MNTLIVFIERNGKQVRAGEIQCPNSNEASFRYTENYLQMPYAAPISISLPLQPSIFSPEQTRIFFEGLLPEGFARKSAASWMKVGEGDYLALLAGLGKECLGAVRIAADSEETAEAYYEKIGKDQIAELAEEGAVKSAQLVTKSHLSLTGATGKTGLYYDRPHDTWYLPMGEAPSTHIVKQSHIRFDGIVTNEQLCLMTAGKLGIKIPESFIINTGNADDGEVLFATERYDRLLSPDSGLISGMKRPLRLHQEDFAQAMGRSSSEKYEKSDTGYLKEMFRILAAYSSNPIEDQLKLWDMILFDYFAGNTDNHIKNFSLLYDENLRGIRLAPAYDIVSTTVYTESTRDMGIAIGGEVRIGHIGREHFRKEAKEIHIGQKIAMEHFDEIGSRFEKALKSSALQLEESGFQKAGKIGQKILESGGIAKYRQKAF